MTDALPPSIALPSANLEDRITLANVSLGAEDNSASATGSTSCIYFDLLVEGKSVGSSLEWLDDDGDVVVDDRNNDVNPDVILAAYSALDDEEIDRSDVAVFVVELLRDAADRFKAAVVDRPRA